MKSDNIVFLILVFIISSTICIVAYFCSHASTSSTVKTIPGNFTWNDSFQLNAKGEGEPIKNHRFISMYWDKDAMIEMFLDNKTGVEYLVKYIGGSVAITPILGTYTVESTVGTNNK